MAVSEYPGSPLPPDSRFYIERPPVEARAAAELDEPGALIRLKAPRQTGKSSLLNRLIAIAEARSCRTAVIDLQMADSEHFQGIDPFLRWVWAYLCRQLDMPSGLADADTWNAEIGSKLNSTLLLESRVLQHCEQPLVLAFNEVNRVFEYPAIAQDFLGLLRHWHERGKLSPLFERLRMIVVHSTDVYVQLDLNQSPFNIGLTLELPPFTLAQVQELASRHELPLAGEQYLQPLLELLGGHPYLVQLAFHHLAHGDCSLPELMRDAPTLQGIFVDHLRYLALQLEHDPVLMQTLQTILHRGETAGCEEQMLYKLDSLGLIERSGTDCRVRCTLHQRFFASQHSLPPADTDRRNGKDRRTMPVGGWRLDPVDERLWLGREQIALPPKAFAMLRYLVENPDRLLTKGELLEHIWPDTYVTEALIKDYIQDLRKTLGDDPKAPHFIENVRGRGYRFIGDIALSAGSRTRNDSG